MHAATAAALAAGMLATPGFAFAREARASRTAEQPGVSKKLEKQVAIAERLAAKAPRSAEARSRLAQSYLAAGRFASAATSFEDAVSLGDQTPVTALRMALSYMGSGRNLEALALLEQWREAIPAGDYGLALALAGQSAQAVTVLGEAIQRGENTPKARQNLAYAYALGGRLREARMIAAQDVPVDQIEARISDWALQASIGSQQSRIAAMLGAPMRRDPGQPAALALATPGQGAVLAQMRPSPLSAQPVATPLPTDELPAVRNAAPMAPVFAQDAPPATSGKQPETPHPAQVATAEIAPASGIRFISNPVVQDISRYAAASLPADSDRREHARMATLSAKPSAPTKPSAPARVPAPALVATRPGATRVAAVSSHAVQLGSFLSEESARRAWDVYVSRDPALQERELRITQAVVNGRRYWRVAAAGYEASAARHMCSAVRSRGRDCLAYAERQPRTPPSGNILNKPVPSSAVAARFARR